MVPNGKPIYRKLLGREKTRITIVLWLSIQLSPKSGPIIVKRPYNSQEVM
jgi:hypothetical protein